MTGEQAAAALKALLHELDGKTVTDAAHIQWQGKVVAVLRSAFGPESDQVRQFRSESEIRREGYTTAKGERRDREHWARDAVTRGCAVVTAAIWELEHVGQSSVGELAGAASSEDGSSMETAAVFIVHGRNLGPATEVARMIEAATSYRAIILREQPNLGQTIIEKFEAHAAEAAFAVVVLTGDDEGRLRESADELKPRGRQNVILELGYFMGRLTRRRVAVLVDPGVEHPSDVAGLVYTELDAPGLWKYTLAKELSEAGIEVNSSKIV